MIISEILFVVNYGSDGSKSTILDQLANWKKSLSEVTADTRKFVDEFKRIGTENVNLDELIHKFSDVDSAVVETANKVKIGNATITDLDTAMQNAATKGSQFAATLKNIATNAGAVLAINLIIQAVSLAWDALNVTVEEQEAKVNNLQAAYQNLSSEYEQLSGKQDLTEAEKNRLSYLERRLALDERILKAEKSQLFEEKTGSKFTDLFDKDNLETQYKKEMAGTDGEWNLLSGFAQNRDGYAYLSGLYERKLDGIRITALLPARIQEDIMQSPSLYCGGLQTGRLMKQKNQPTTKPKRRKILWTILQMNPGTILNFQPVKRQKPRNLKKPLLTGSLNFQIS